MCCCAWVIAWSRAGAELPVLESRTTWGLPLMVLQGDICFHFLIWGIEGIYFTQNETLKPPLVTQLLSREAGHHHSITLLHHSITLLQLSGTMAGHLLGVDLTCPWAFSSRKRVARGGRSN